MAIASGSRHSLAYVAEVTQGTTPATPVFSPVRHTGCTLRLDKTTITSAEIRSDRQITDVRHGNFQVGGDIPVELSYGSHDVLLQAMFGGTWADKATITATTLSAEAADNSYNDSGSGFVTAGFEVGDIIEVTGFTGNVANNITRGVLTHVAAGKIRVAGADGDVIVDDAAGESVTISTVSQVLKGGTTRRFFTFERHFADLTQYLRYKGCEMNSLALSVAPNAMATATMGVIGLAADPAAGAIIAGATYGSATTTSPMDSFTGTIEENGSVVAVVTQIQLDINNGLEPLFVVGQAAAAGISIGRFTVGGTITVYFDSVTLFNKFVNETESDLMFETGDVAGNLYRWKLPRIKYNGAPPDVSGEGPVTLAMPIQALYDATAGTSLSVERIPA
jgi:sporulation protein YlmC with PRC-barrel domain